MIVRHRNVEMFCSFFLLGLHENRFLPPKLWWWQMSCFWISTSCESSWLGWGLDLPVPVIVLISMALVFFASEEVRDLIFWVLFSWIFCKSSMTLWPKVSRFLCTSWLWASRWEHGDTVEMEADGFLRMTCTSAELVHLPCDPSWEFILSFVVSRAGNETNASSLTVLSSVFSLCREVFDMKLSGDILVSKWSEL